MAQVNLKETATPQTPPADYIGLFFDTGQAYIINDAGGTSLLGGATAFVGLSDVPSSYTGQGGKVVKVNVGESALEFDDETVGAVDFTDLGDVPSSYTGQAGKVVAVNGGETALEFITVAGSGTVTSVAISATDGLQVDSGSPITTNGTITLGVDAAALRTHINVADGATALPNGTTNGQLLRWNGTSWEVATDAIATDDLLDITITDGVDTSYVYLDPTTFQLSMEAGAGLIEWNGTGFNVVGGLYLGGVSAGNEVVKDSDLEAEERASNTVLFDKNYIIGNAGARSGNILFDFTGAKRGAWTEMKHNDASAFTFPTEAMLMFDTADISTTVDNYFLFVITDKTGSSEVVKVFHALEGGV